MKISMMWRGPDCWIGTDLFYRCLVFSDLLKIYVGEFTILCKCTDKETSRCPMEYNDSPVKF